MANQGDEHSVKDEVKVVPDDEVQEEQHQNDGGQSHFGGFRGRGGRFGNRRPGPYVS